MEIPTGFKLQGIRCGIKEKGKDLGLILSEIPATASCVITKNRLKSPSVLITKKNTKNRIKAVIVNSGCANCATKYSEKDAKEIIKKLSQQLKIKEKEIAIAQTGIIGKRIPLEKIKNGIEILVKEIENPNLENFIKAIMTTDTKEKFSYLRFKVNKKFAKILGIAKGSGMIAPDLATMLVFILTDLAISKKLLDKALKIAVEKSFNLISVDGDTSPNDLVLILANGGLKNDLLSFEDKNFLNFQKALEEVTLQLSKKIIEDAEGANKFVEIEIKGAKNLKEAKIVAKSIANSPLVKTAFFGEDANWGRILSAIGNSGIPLDINSVDIYFDRLKVCKNGFAENFEEEAAKKILKNENLKIMINLKRGKEKLKFYTCDLSYEYVRINAEYRT
jgi:glutamate N-acetyltransferase/amino-acid N-acetyltransferase